MRKFSLLYLTSPVFAFIIHILLPGMGWLMLYVAYWRNEVLPVSLRNYLIEMIIIDDVFLFTTFPICFLLGPIIIHLHRKNVKVALEYLLVLTVCLCLYFFYDVFFIRPLSFCNR